MSETPPTLFWSAATAAGLGAAAGLNRLLALFPRLQFTDVVRRWRGCAYVAFSALIAAGALCLIRYLSEPGGRLGAVEQVLLAALGTNTVIRPGVQAKHSLDTEPPTGAAPVERAGALFDSLLRSLAREIENQLEIQALHLVEDASWVEYRKVRTLFYPNLAQVVSARSEGARAEFTKNFLAIEDKALESLGEARNELLYLTLTIAGEKYLKELLKIYRAQHPPL